MPDAPSAPTTQRYSARAKILHWAMAVLVLLMLLGGNQMPGGTGPEKVDAAMMHTGFGLLLAAVSLAAFINRLRHAPPALPDSIAKFQRVVSTWTHRALYLLIALQVIAGLGIAATAPYVVRSFGILPLSSLAADDIQIYRAFKETHEMVAFALLVLAGVHIAAALYHHFIARDIVLRRMWPAAKLP